MTSRRAALRIIARAGMLLLLFQMGLLSPLPSARAIEPKNVLVLYNNASPDSQQIANYYQQTYPGVNIVGLNGVSSAEQVTADHYLNVIRPQVLAALMPLTDVIVTTKGLPLRIDVGPEPAGAPGFSWERYSSLESELARIDRIESELQMGDQTYWWSEQTSWLWNPSPPGAATTSTDLFGNPVGYGAEHLAANPYYYRAGNFDHELYGTRLTSRLDGFTVADVIASIDRAQNAFVGPPGFPNGPFHFIVDDDPSATGGFNQDRMQLLASDVLDPAGMPYVYDNTSAFLQNAPGPVLAYVGHGANGSAPNNYLIDSEIGIQFDLADGAVFHSWESFNAKTFDSSIPVGLGQGSVAQWLAYGGTAGLGHVEEPGANSVNVSNEDRFLQMMLEGYTFAEAAWSSTAQLSFVNTVVGDPLMRYRQLLPGDANMDGEITSTDLLAILLNLNATGQPGGYMWHQGDFDSNGMVNSTDILLFGQSWDAGGSETTGTANASDVAVPEPSSGVLIWLGVIAFMSATGRRTRSLH